jgi:hypothetical protein
MIMKHMEIKNEGTSLQSRGKLIDSKKIIVVK